MNLLDFNYVDLNYGFKNKIDWNETCRKAVTKNDLKNKSLVFLLTKGFIYNYLMNEVDNSFFKFLSNNYKDEFESIEPKEVVDFIDINHLVDSWDYRVSFNFDEFELYLSEKFPIIFITFNKLSKFI